MARTEPTGQDARGASAGDEALSFDARLERLESLVAELEEGGLELEPAIDRYQEGIRLLKGCHEVLAGYRKQVEELTREAQDALRPFDGDPDAGGGAESGR